MKYWWLLVLVVLLSACTSEPVAEPTGTPTHVETITPRIIPLLTLQEPTVDPPTRTPITPAEVEIPPEYVGDGLSDDGPWLLFSIEYHNLWILNADGTGLTDLSNENFDLLWWDLESKISPSGKYMAVLDRVDRVSRLNLISLPSGEYKTLTPLVTFDDPDSSQAVSTSDWSASWSPDEKYLAFIAKMDQPSADVYLYDMETEEISRLTWGEYDAFYPTWSPDSKYIVHAAGWHGTGAGHYMAEVWASRVTDRKNIFVYTPLQEYDKSRDMDRSVDERFIGWKDNVTFLATTGRHPLGDSDFRSVNILTGEIQYYWFDWFDEVDVSPETRTAILLSSPRGSDEIIFLFPLRDISLINLDTYTSTVLIESYDIEENYSYNLVQWSPELNAYLFLNKDGITTISPEGEIVVYSDIKSYFIPKISVAGYWAWGNEELNDWYNPYEWGINGLWVGYPDGEHIQVTERNVADVVWSPDGSRLFFVAGDTSLVLYMAEAPEFIPIPIAKILAKKNGYNFVDMAWAIP